MSTNLVLQHLRNQLTLKEIMSMMNIVNIFNSAYRLSLCIFYVKMTTKRNQNTVRNVPTCSRHDSGHWNLQTWTWRSPVAEAQSYQMKLWPQSEGTERSQDWQTACWQQGQEQQAEPWLLAVDINPWTPSLHNTEGELSKEQFHTELAE